MGLRPGGEAMFNDLYFRKLFIKQCLRDREGGGMIAKLSVKTMSGEGDSKQC